MRFRLVVALFFMMGMLLAVPALSQSVDSIRAAAEKGDPIAQTTMGALYRHGMGVPQSDKDSAQWYLKAANQGNAGAQTVVGVMYMEGKGVEKDEAKARSWLQKAAKQGDTTANSQLKSMRKTVSIDVE
ncbi:MAG: sel1 repeat family protein [Magnetococcales bacterium]|nr:sel1 repeat family protein [Magnetococcales bacterium]